eukprot:3071099-Rhodomonas_salina.1
MFELQPICVPSALARGTFVGAFFTGEPLTHYGACDADPTRDLCILPINANITLHRTGVGTVTRADVSLDLYASNSSFPAAAIEHDTAQRISTVIRIVFPENFQLCDSVVEIQGGGLDGVSGVSGAFKKVSPEGKGSGLIEPNPRLDAPRTGEGADGGFDPCTVTVSSCSQRMFEIESMSEAAQTSETVGLVQRLRFTIANILLPSGTVDPFVSPVVNEEMQFGVQLFRKEVESRGQSGDVPRFRQRYYNNRVNDPLLNRTVLTWFDKTSSVSPQLVANELWAVSVDLLTPISLAFTDVVVSLTTTSRIPAEGGIRVAFPDGFEVSSYTGVSVRALGTTLTAAGDRAERVIAARSFERENNVSSVLLFEFANRGEVLFTIRNVRTSKFAATGPFYVETLSPTNQTLDFGTAPSVALGPNQLENVVVMLSDYTAGASGVEVT